MQAHGHRLGACAWLLTLQLGTAAAQDKPGDYAYMMALGVSGTQSAAQLQLPRAVYQGSRSPGLDDLRMFDAAGKPVPFAIVPADQMARATHRMTPTALFPVRARLGSTAPLPDYRTVRTDADGAVIGVKTSTDYDGDHVVASLLLDTRPAARPAPGIASPISALVLAAPPSDTPYTAKLAFEASDDMRRWTPLADTAVSWPAARTGAVAATTRVAFPPRAFRYARVRWLAGTPVKFAAISAEHAEPTDARVPWQSIELHAEERMPGDDLVYRTAAALPVESVGLVLFGHNEVVPATIGIYEKVQGTDAAETPRTVFRELAAATFQQLTANGLRQVSEDIDVPRTHAEYWGVRLRKRGPGRPGLRLRWKPATIVFRTAGEGPYLLAFGRDRAPPAAAPLEQVAPSLDERSIATLERASASEPVEQDERPPAGRTDPPGPGAGRPSWSWPTLGDAATVGMSAWRPPHQRMPQRD